MERRSTRNRRQISYRSYKNLSRLQLTSCPEFQEREARSGRIQRRQNNSFGEGNVSYTSSSQKVCRDSQSYGKKLKPSIISQSSNSVEKNWRNHYGIFDDIEQSIDKGDYKAVFHGIKKLTCKGRGSCKAPTRDATGKLLADSDRISGSMEGVCRQLQSSPRPKLKSSVVI